MVETLRPRLRKPSSRLRRPGECAAYRIGLPSDDLQIRLRRFIGTATVLLPIAQRPERNAKGLGKFGLRHVKRPANPLRQRNAPNPSKPPGLTVLDRERCGIGSGLDPHLILLFGAAST